MAEDIDLTGDWEAVKKKTEERKASPRPLTPGEMLEKIHRAVQMLSHTRNPTPEADTATAKISVMTYLYNEKWYAEVNMPAFYVPRLEGKSWDDVITKLHASIMTTIQSAIDDRTKEIEKKERDIASIKSSINEISANRSTFERMQEMLLE